MTDKQIIDGKECRYWFRYNTDDYRKCSLRGKDDNCDEIKDCFVKELLGKLAQKEQECESLKKQLIDFMNGEYCANGCAKMQSQYIEFHNNLVHQLDKLKAEKEEIKKYLGISSKTIMERLEELQEFRDNDKYKLYQAEQTLAEIKEIAQYDVYTTRTDLCLKLNWIKKKISECEVGK